MSNEFRQDSVLINDADIAGMLGMSRSWVRKQRFNRRRGLPHTLTIDPVMIGSAPRYRRLEVRDWVASLDNEPSGSAEQAEGAECGTGPSVTTSPCLMPGCSHDAEGEG